MANTRNYGKIKGRPNFANGGSVPPYAKWLGAGPESYPAMRAEMSPSDFAIYKASVSPQEYNTFMGISSPPTPATPALAAPAPTPAPPPAAQAAPLPTAPAFNPQPWNPQTAAKPAIAPQAQENVKPYVKAGPVA